MDGCKAERCGSTKPSQQCLCVLLCHDFTTFLLLVVFLDQNRSSQVPFGGEPRPPNTPPSLLPPPKEKHAARRFSKLQLLCNKVCKNRPGARQIRSLSVGQCLLVHACVFVPDELKRLNSLLSSTCSCRHLTYAHACKLRLGGFMNRVVVRDWLRQHVGEWTFIHDFWGGWGGYCNA